MQEKFNNPKWRPPPLHIVNVSLKLLVLCNFGSACNHLNYIDVAFVLNICEKAILEVLHKFS